MDKQLFGDLKQSLNEAVEHSQGKRQLKTATRVRKSLTLEDLKPGEVYYHEYDVQGIMFAGLFRADEVNLDCKFIRCFSNYFGAIDKNKFPIEFESGTCLHKCRRASKEEIKKLERAEEAYFEHNNNADLLEV